MDRIEANSQLLLPGNPPGTFLVRNSAGESGNFIDNFFEVYFIPVLKYNNFTKRCDTQQTPQIVSVLKINTLNLQLVSS